MNRLNRRTLISLAFIALIVVRFLLILNAIKYPIRWLTVDSNQYIELAQGLLDTGRYQSIENPDLDLFRTPGYPAFLAILFGITGDSLSAVVIAQFILSLSCAWILYILGTSIAGSSVGTMAAFLLLLSPNTLFWSATLMAESVFMFGLILAFFWMTRASIGSFPGWASGLLLGLMVLVRPISLYLILLWGIWYFLFLLRREVWQRVLQRVSLFVIGALVVVIPWHVRNLSQHGIFALSRVSSTTFKVYHLALTLVEAEGLPWEEAKLKVFGMGGSLDAAKEIISSYPGPFAKTQFRGISRTIIGTDVETWMQLATNRSYEGSGIQNALVSGEFSSILASLSDLANAENLVALGFLIWGGGYAFVLIILLLLGLIRGWKSANRLNRSIFLFGAFTILYLILSPGAAGEARFRVPVEPLLALFAGFSVSKIKPVTLRQRWI
jgi:4-amino-4-deoxy-L-arabinose transferase-like glycosyltransferase